MKPQITLSRIALVTDGVQPYVMGGMQQHSFSLAKYFAQNQIAVDLYHFNRSSHVLHKLEFFTEAERKYIHSVEVPFPELKKMPGHYLRASWQHSAAILKQLQQRPRVDFIYVQGLTGLEMLKQKAKGLTLPPVGVNFHGLEMFQPTQGVKDKLAAMQLRRLVRFCFSRADVVFTFGGKVRTIVEDLEVPAQKIIESPLGVSREWLANETKACHSPLRALFVGRYERRKGITQLNEVMRSTVAQVPVEFHLAGPLPAEAQLHHPAIHYHGAISDRQSLLELYRSCDLLLLPSLAEGMPTVIAEAMASGLAVLATDVGAVAQLVNEERGWLLPPGDAAAMTRALLAACKHPEGVVEKKRAALAFAQQELLWENVMKSLLTKIETAISL